LPSGALECQPVLSSPGNPTVQKCFRTNRFSHRRIFFKAKDVLRASLFF
jgi:hypothetical protein